MNVNGQTIKPKVEHLPRHKIESAIRLFAVAKIGNPKNPLANDCVEMLGELLQRRDRQETMEQALIASRALFMLYASQHEAKRPQTDETRDKASRNRHAADTITQALRL